MPDDADSTGSIVTLPTTPDKVSHESLTGTPNKGVKPARPPPPVLTPDKIHKNTSALHHIISPRNALFSAFSGIGSPLKPPGKFSAFNGLGNSPLSCKKLSFSAVSRPLPDAPAKTAEDGEIYCDIEEEDYYEENDVEGVHLLNGNTTTDRTQPMFNVQNLPISELPPPLPSRGPPPVPSIEKILDRNKVILNEDHDIFEEYDIPGESSDLPSVVNAAKNTNLLLKSVGNESRDPLSPVPHDLPSELPFFAVQSPPSRVVYPPIPEKGSLSTTQFNSVDEDDNFYKVPNSSLVTENIYQVPASIPIPVNNNTNGSIMKGVTGSVVTSLNTPSTLLAPSSEVYQIPTSEQVPVPKSSDLQLKTNDIDRSPKHSQNGVIDASKTESNLNNATISNNFKSKRILEQGKTTDYGKSTLVKNSGSKLTQAANNQSVNVTLAGSQVGKRKNISVKERIALLNNKEAEYTVDGTELSKSSDNLVVRLDTKEITLDHATKRAFLESTLMPKVPSK